MSSMSYLAYELLPYCHAMQSEGSDGSAAVLVRQQRMTLPTINQQWVLGSVTKNQLSMTELLTPALVAGNGTIITFQIPQS